MMRKKIVLLDKKPQKMVKYINESEIIIVNSKTDLYGTNIIYDGNYNLFKA